MDAARPESNGCPRVLFISADPVGAEMSGLGIRYWELARALSAQAHVTIAHGGEERQESHGVRTVPYRPHAPRDLHALIAASDTVVTHPQWPLVNRWLKRTHARVVVDLYCPETLETLELLTGRRAFARRQLTALTIDRLHASLRVGHHFMCASETQRDLWLGAMLALRLIEPELYDRDPGLREVIDLVPFGVPDVPLSRDGALGPRELVDGIVSESEIVLWNGGIWDWLDARTAIRAVAELARRRPGVHLVFMGAQANHPAATRSTKAARALAAELGVLDSVVHFHDGWVPYAERGAWLAQADCALSTHAEHLETRFAYRTRLLDCMWASLPIVCSSGDDLAELVVSEELGAVAAPGEVATLSVALESVLERGRGAYGAALRAAAREHAWSRVVRPLARWVETSRATPRPGDARGAARPSMSQRAREGAYLLGGRAILARR